MSLHSKYKRWFAHGVQCNDEALSFVDTMAASMKGHNSSIFISSVLLAKEICYIQFNKWVMVGRRSMDVLHPV